MTRSFAVWFVSIFASFAASCSLFDGKSKGGDDGGMTPGGDVGECVGSMVNPTEYDDSSSCLLQHGIWVGWPDYDCQSNYSNRCSDAPVAGGAESLRRDCIGRIGCTYRAPDGSEAQNPYLGGSCSGRSVPCDWIGDRATCDLQGSACHWRDDSYTAFPNTCETAYPATYVAGIYECQRFIGGTEGIHPEVARGYCLDRIGCVWTNADGTVENSAKSDVFVAEPIVGTPMNDMGTVVSPDLAGADLAPVVAGDMTQGGPPTGPGGPPGPP